MKKAYIKETDLDYIGKRYGILTVIKPIIVNNMVHFECICDCGNTRYVRRANIKYAKSCGCKFTAHKNFKQQEKITITKTGYVYILAPSHPRAKYSGRIEEHIFIMEQKLGRYLLPKEEVHHLNGIKDDNRLENLELWSTSHPKGQRVEDKIKWAKEILEVYKDYVPR